jgi:membrane-bound lytic murein transglycosylase A
LIRKTLTGFAFLTCTLTGCRKPPPPSPAAPPAKLDYARELPPGQVALRKVSPGEYPDFAAGLLRAGNLDALRAAVGNSLAYLSRPGSRNAYPYLDVTHDRAVATLEAFRELLNDPSLLSDASRLNNAIAQRFDVYKSLGAPAPDNARYTGRVLFTGYFTPTYDASLTRTDEFRYPLYRRPADLPADASGEALPYYTRAEIEGRGMLAGDEIVWLKDRWQAYTVTVQGSARLRLRDGRILELGYAGNNGREYASPAMKMVDDGLIRKQDVSAATLRDYFARNPQLMDKYLWHNPRTVFFAERPGGPYGSLNVPVTPLATIATDKKVYPPALPAFVVIPPGPDARGGPWHQFMLDQDTGGAIRAAGRCDLYLGVGDEAERRAGDQLGEGELFYFAVKQVG